MSKTLQRLVAATAIVLFAWLFIRLFGEVDSAGRLTFPNGDVLAVWTTGLAATLFITAGMIRMMRRSRD
jgi:preprotein translocase subunit SecF